MIFDETEQGQIYDRLLVMNQVNFSQGEVIRKLRKQRDWSLAIACLTTTILIIKLVI